MGDFGFGVCQPAGEETFQEIAQWIAEERELVECCAGRSAISGKAWRRSARRSEARVMSFIWRRYSKSRIAVTRFASGVWLELSAICAGKIVGLCT